MGASAKRLAVADRGEELRRKTQKAAAAVRVADFDDGGTAAHPAEGIVRRQKTLRDGVAERGAALLEGLDETVRERRVASQLAVGRGQILENADGLLHRLNA